MEAFLFYARYLDIFMVTHKNDLPKSRFKFLLEKFEFNVNLVSSARIELTTYRLGGDCSILLSYEDIYNIRITLIIIIFEQN